MLRRVLKKYFVSHPHQGFTLIEILVSMIMAGIIVSSLLFLVVDLLRVDRRELTLEQTQQDMKRALDYISDDLREAVYVYSEPTRITTLVTNLASTAHRLPDHAQPVLAFWRVKALEDSDLGDSDLEDYEKLLTAAGAANCSSLSGNQVSSCNALLVRHGYYELVIYYSTEDNNDNRWDGKARIYRYSLPEYSTAALTGAAQLLPDTVFGSGSPSPNFSDWVPESGSPSDSRNIAALVDFVAELDPSGGTTPACDSDYTLAPSTTTTTAAGGAVVSNSFYACVRPLNRANNLLQQDVRIFLQGDANPDGKNSQVLGKTAVSGNSKLPTLETQILIGGVIDKNLSE